MNTTVAVMWDCNGLEAVERIGDLDQRRVWAVLQGQDPNRVQVNNLLHWRLRAQANPQRNYEIYVVQLEEDITVEDITEAFAANPQMMADTVRRIGHRFYSDRRDEQEVRIR